MHTRVHEASKSVFVDHGIKNAASQTRLRGFTSSPHSKSRSPKVERAT